MTACRPTSSIRGTVVDEIDGGFERVSHAAKRARVSPSFLYAMIREDRLRAVKIGGMLLVRVSDIDAYIVERSHKAVK